MKRRGFTLIEALVVLAIILILAAILFPLFARGGHDSPRSSCLINIKQVGLGVMQYIQDYDERFPPIAISAVASSTQFGSGPYGWADAIQPYIKSTGIYHCPTVKKQRDHTKKNRQNDAVIPYYTDYYYNTNLDRVLQGKVPNPAMLVLCGEGNDGTDGTDARYNRNVIPQVWLDTENSPARRHLDIANYLFADGHVKSVKPASIKSKRQNANDYSFAIR
jgi:prepilin-type N-terminal cleavage/methylation domain-containing protein/prepilin-type processing-associated H-X9-DG protein